MKKSNYNFAGLLVAVLTYVSRFSFLPANVSPLGAFGFFGGNIFFYFLSILAFDFFKGGFYQGFLWTYLGFATYPFFAFLAKKFIKRQLLFLPLASFSFFILSNFGVFFAWYDHSWQGFLTCYALALPFYSRTLLGDLFFGYGFLLLKKVKNLAISHSSGYNIL
ncbi:MAG: hypothetical protein UT13_C0001G0389 [Candidatus Pacebacteria bacterium GW2011_GWF2_38_9]|nr:MAG: hypothetical protein US01_C0001G0399 [candidate division TM6 bacterium GW2011_GWF2_28_16]KKQ07640.1 MAG: hypothetical protein US20_C0033G0004 [Candidatus Pacebacteria bacterium GW2011_GWF1_36_5]KKQ88742.1 MAG: hypothetical protein UT13_C0001G0389 [Candidatus Pacebacteria bacterium GW2011_GWF2_38_9]HAZ73727.1 hypothetical protein [Candidatus Paceibacterota bacterium]